LGHTSHDIGEVDDVATTGDTCPIRKNIILTEVSVRVSGGEREEGGRRM